MIWVAVLLAGAFLGAAAGTVVAQRRQLRTERPAWGEYWESVVQMLDEDPNVDEVGLRRSIRAHPAGKGRQR